MGQRFDRLVVESRERIDPNGSVWNCLCDCGARCQRLTGWLRKDRKKAACPACMTTLRRQPVEHGAHLIGQVFDRLTVISLKESTPSGRLWSSRCACGNEVDRLTTQLRGGTSMGCKACEPLSRSVAHLTHGGAFSIKSELYLRWKGIRNRCENPSDTSYRYYGALGVKRCAEWSDFAAFRDWAMANGYQPGLSIDRINPFGNYEPSNCRWCTRSENSKGSKRKTYQASAV